MPNVVTPKKMTEKLFIIIFRSDSDSFYLVGTAEHYVETNSTALNP